MTGNQMDAGLMWLPKMDGVEVSPGIYLIGEPTPVPDTALLRCLANVNGALALVELSLKFVARTHGETPLDEAA